MLCPSCRPPMRPPVGWFMGQPSESRGRQGLLARSHQWSVVWLGCSPDPRVLTSCLISSITDIVMWSLKANIIQRSLGTKPQAHGFTCILP